MRSGGDACGGGGGGGRGGGSGTDGTWQLCLRRAGVHTPHTQPAASLLLVCQAKLDGWMYG